MHARQRRIEHGRQLGQTQAGKARMPCVGEVISATLVCGDALAADATRAQHQLSYAAQMPRYPTPQTAPDFVPTCAGRCRSAHQVQCALHPRLLPRCRLPPPGLLLGAACCVLQRIRARYSRSEPGGPRRQLDPPQRVLVAVPFLVCCAALLRKPSAWLGNCAHGRLRAERPRAESAVGQAHPHPRPKAQAPPKASPCEEGPV